MSDHPSTYQLLAILGDARIEGRIADMAAVLDEIGASAAYVKLSVKVPAWRPFLLRGSLLDQAPDDYARAEALEENRQERLRCNLDQLMTGRDWWPR